MGFLIAAISLGLLGSFHCIGMCGPIALALPVHNKPPLVKYTLIFLYNLGRIITYSVLGVLAGIVGKSFIFAGLQQVLSVSVGIALLVYVFIPFRNGVSGYPFFLWIRTSFERVFSMGSRSSLFLVGLLNGLLPCGLVYVGLAGAVATGDLLKGALFMAGFGLGTFPMMILVPVSGGLITMPVRKKIRKAIPVVIAVMAVFLILRGLNLGIPYVSPKVDRSGTVATCHSQPAIYPKGMVKCAVPHKN